MKKLLGFVVWLVLWLFVKVARRPSFTFPDPKTRAPYLRRWPILTRDKWPDAQGRTGGEGWYLHEFLASDHERELHNHPSACSVAFVLRGGYREMRLQRDERTPAHRIKVCRPGSMNVITSETFHRVTLLGKRSWSLFWIGPRSGRGWGFLRTDGTIRRAAHHDANTGETIERDDAS